jgi:hypothetical protein
MFEVAKSDNEGADSLLTASGLETYGEPTADMPAVRFVKQLPQAFAAAAFTNQAI